MFDLKGIGMRHKIESEKAVQVRTVRSKICTTNRTKERRIRLSADTAIRFYDVQDRLGYDRASKAIDWLMKEAKVAIDALNDETQDVNQGYQEPATTTNFNSSETFHGTAYDQNQHNTFLDQTSSFDHHLFGNGVLDPINRFPEETNLFSNSKVSLDFTWNPNCIRGEGYDFVSLEPLQFSFARPDAHTSNSGVNGFCYQQEIQVQEDEYQMDNPVVVPGHNLPSDSSVSHYQD
ncbi:hypothetical protein L2E82_31127 [Cichorium intybus]|uniref:Uncharacterized protein n=1 Tax=Cichorium intybus TaxID=13427 RepID=A0ACB9D264_CICIN|nr:hypothetical protein L2E82_31127 [Cichorium intybus]